jgi:FkbH-like protein
VVLKRPRAKVIAVDADNTLWGGIIGEDGMHGIALGPDYPGNAYVAFQRRLLQYQQRGFVLALCSKNNEADVLEVLRDHPHQVLRERHFAAIAVNWEPKPGNLQRIAEELGLGLESFVFVDDSLHECGAVRAALPIVDVVPAPANPIELPTCLDRIGRLEILTLTKEDQQKTQMYVEQRQRAQLEAASTDLESYLQSLHMEMHVTLNDSRHVARIAQLTQKTNQFNLTTRRYTEDAIARLIEADDSIVATFSLRDIFGDSGLVGIALLRVESTTAVLDSFLLSCRVIGRRAESAFFNTLLRVLRARGVDRVRGEFIPTAKNKLAESFLTDHAFAASDGAYERDLRIAPPLGDDAYPIRVEITGARDGELMELVRQS